MINNKDKYLIIATSTSFTPGASRTLVVDTRGSYFFIPNLYYKLLNQYSKKKFSELLNVIDEDSIGNLYSFMKYMAEREIVFFSDYPEWFPEMPNKLTNDYYHLIDSIIEIEEEYTDYDIIKKIVSELDVLRCKQVQLRLIDGSINYIISVIELFDDSNISYLELRINNTLLSHTYLEEILQKFAFVTHITVYEARENKKKLIEFEEVEGFEKLLCGTIYYVKQSMSDSKHGGCCEISLHTMQFNDIKYFHRAKKYNSSLYKRVAIDSRGNIKNCLSMNEIFGNVQDISISEIINSDKFKSIWFIKKDDIEICRDCEFRYHCNDCRAFVDRHAKPLKCKYDPYTTKWG